MRRRSPIFLALTILYFFCPSSGHCQADSNWVFSLSGFFYYVPEDENSLSLIGYSDYKNFHLEARYNYEDRNTGSVFGGWRFEAGNKFQFAATPMIGVIFGNIDGIAPGLELEAAYGKFSYYSETEYVIDFSGKENKFIYTWGEFVFKPIQSLDVGISYQRSRVYETGLDVQRGVLAKYSFGKFTAGAYYFNPFSEDNLLIISFTLDF